MAYQIKILAEAEEELDEAIRHYENVKEGLGVNLLHHFFNRLAYLKESPLIYQKTYKSYRRLLMKKYPYAVYYIVDEQKKEVVVIALWHTYANPKRLKNSLE